MRNKQEKEEKTINIVTSAPSFTHSPPASFPPEANQRRVTGVSEGRRRSTQLSHRLAQGGWYEWPP